MRSTSSPMRGMGGIHGVRSVPARGQCGLDGLPQRSCLEVKVALTISRSDPG
jgi:hypothetical protein